MLTVGVLEAKKHFSDILDRVARGEKVTIARRGVPVALLVPARQMFNRPTHQEVVEGMRALRKRVRRSDMSIREMVAVGRKH
jgi:prevent-host-death family protein